MRNPPSVGPRLYFPIHSRRPYWNCTSQLLLRHRPPRHLLCSSPFPLRLINGSRICHCCSFCPLVSSILRVYPPQYLNKNSLWYYVRRRKSYLLPPALLRPGRHAPTILRLPRRLYTMKHSLLCRILNFTNRRNYVFIHYLRSICCKT